MFEAVFKKKFVVIGMVHLKPLPGSVKYDGESIEEIEKSAIDDAKILMNNGVDGLMIENFGDKPFLNERIDLFPLLIMTRIVSKIISFSSVPVGVNIEFNCWKEEITLAKATGASFIRVEVFNEFRYNNAGILFPSFSKLLRLRKELNANDVMIFADLNVKHTYPIFDRDVEDLLDDFNKYVDAMIITGTATGKPVDLEFLKRVKSISKVPVLVGSGVKPDNIDVISRIADGAIVGTFFKRDGIVENPVDPTRVQKLMKILVK
ncbi:MAG: hypothetical protein DRP30_04870 [Thermotoga sp.]|nr:MAG: hypothetical protein DRP30_04870 [Thermotoga sp.]